MKLISSVALARTREELHNSWDKNDPKYAQVILHMMTIGAEQFYHDPLRHDLNDIQELSKTHDIVSKSKTELWHRLLIHYLPLYFPEVDRLNRTSRSDWFMAFLEQLQSFLTPQALDLFVIDCPAFNTEQLSDLAIAIAAILFGQSDHRHPRAVITLF